MSRSRLSSGARLALAGGVVSTAFSLLYQWPGVVLPPDGWAYWEGSVSLLRGEGYRYLLGEPIRLWPPGFPVYLALWQLVFGVSAGTLAVAHAVAIGFAVAIWIAVAMRLYPSRGLPPSAFAAAVVLTFGIAIGLRSVVSESLFLALLAAATFAALGPRDAATAETLAKLQGGNAGGRTALFWLLVSGMLLTRHSGVAYLPALAWLAWKSSRRDSPRARKAVLLAAAGGFLVWFAIFVGLGMVGENRRIPFDATAWSRLAENVASNLVALASNLLPSSSAGFSATVVMAGGLLLLPGLTGGLGRSAQDERRAGIAGLFAATVLASVGAVIVAAIYGVAGRRIVLPVTVLIVLVVTEIAECSPRRGWRRVATALLLTLAAVQIGRSAYWSYIATTTGRAGLGWTVELVPPCAFAEPCRPAPGQVEPPDFPWIERRAPAPTGQPEQKPGL